MQPVFLHVYDVGTSQAMSRINHVVRTVGLGAFHGAIEVYGREWSFGGTDDDETGVFDCAPRECDMHTYRETISLGETEKTEAEVRAILNMLMASWPGRSYSLTGHNCCTFCEAFASLLGVQPPPAWLNRTAKGADTVHRGVKSAVALGRRSLDRVMKRGEKTS